MTTFTTTFNFKNYEEMDYCFSHLDCDLEGFTATRNEFDGSAPNEVVIVTTKPIPQTTVKKMLKHYDPLKSKVNR